MSTNNPNAEFNRRTTVPNKLGLTDEGCMDIDCADCGQDLMVLQKTKSNATLIQEGESPIKTVILVLCEICGGRSYLKTVEGQFYPGSPNDEMGFEPVDADEWDHADIVFKAWKS